MPSTMIFTLLASQLALATDGRFPKLQAVLQHLGVPREQPYSEQLKPWDGKQTRQGFETILKYTDPAGAFSDYADWDDEKLTVFQDRTTREVVDFTLSFKKTGLPSDPHGLVKALRDTATNPPNLPLQSLRIALDPGHMGGRRWDLKTGKFVQAPDGRYVSEGALAFQTCLLLARTLRALGAEVMLTRSGLTPVTDAPLATYELAPYVETEIRSSSDLAWFDRLLGSAPLGPRLFRMFERSPEIAALKNPAKRDQYFIKRVDLGARAEKINAFHPHLVLCIHFDASENDRLQNFANVVRGYVPGNVLPGELATRAQRFEVARNLFDGHRWVEGNVFTAALVRQLSDATGIKLETRDRDFRAVKVADGVYARNLALNRLISEGIFAYLEVLNYDYTPEFGRLVRRDRHTSIDGIKLDYPARLEAVVGGLKQGVLDYVRSMQRKG